MTYSIVARDPASGELGVAVQSHFFSVGGVVPAVAAGVGAAATQAFAEPSFAPLAIELLRAGRSPEQAVASLAASDGGALDRQLAVVDAHGAVAAHTGSRCIAEAGHRTGDGYSVQANMMTNGTVPDAMAEAYEAAGGDLADRLLAALDAAEREGGDIRGRQSAALVIVGGDRAEPAWQKHFDLRVEDHPEPLVELRRLVAMRRAYTTSDPGDAMGSNPELAFWRGVAHGAAGQVDEARRWLSIAFAVDDNWRELLRRLPAAGRFPDDGPLIEALTKD